MARQYKRDKKGRFASTGASSGKSKKPRKSDLSFQKSGKGGGTSVKAGRAAKAAYKAKEGQRRLTNLTKRDKGSQRWTGGSQTRKKYAAKRTAYSKGAFESGTRKSTKRRLKSSVSPQVKAQRKAAAQAKTDARINKMLKERRAFAAKTRR